jgi:dynein heavy chain
LPHDHVAPEYRDSFHVLLLQEIDRYSTLIDTILEGLKVYQEAEQGKCLMTEELERMRYSLAEGRVPKAWNDRCYYSNKQLGEWLADLTNRLRFINQWIR